MSRYANVNSMSMCMWKKKEGNSGGRMAQSLHQDIIWGDGSGQRPHTSPRSGECSTQPMWSSSFGSRHQLHGSLFGAGCFLLGETVGDVLPVARSEALLPHQGFLAS